VFVRLFVELWCGDGVGCWLGGLWIDGMTWLVLTQRADLIDTVMALNEYVNIAWEEWFVWR
jgi:hypothetical protein